MIHSKRDGDCGSGTRLRLEREGATQLIDALAHGDQSK
jgi:hypothetical protein